MADTLFTKEQIAGTLGVQPYILAAWEKQFDVAPLIENDVQIYTPEHLSTFKKIKELLYEKGMTMAAVKKALQDTNAGLEESTFIAASPLFFDTKKALSRDPLDHTPSAKAQEITSKLRQIKSQLIKISTSL